MMTLEILEKIVTACRTAKVTDDALHAVGYMDTPYFEIYSNIIDAIYSLLGERTETLDQSITYRIMERTDLTNRQRAELLLSAITNA